MNDSAGFLAERMIPSPISRGVEALFSRIEPGPGSAQDPYDVVIVGSGYGGAVAAAKLSGLETRNRKRVTVCVLERGAEYLAGTFPTRMSDIASHVRFSTPGASSPRGLRDGLFDVRLGGDVNALVANGLGGGSLINAGVMAEPEPEIFQHRGWPRCFRDPAARKALYHEAKLLLGATLPPRGDGPADPVENSFEGRPLQKLDALTQLAKADSNARFIWPSISMSLDPEPGRIGPAPIGSCNLCGDCATGCNQGAKNSLDMNLLDEAYKKKAEIFTGATVLRLERSPRSEESWCLEVVHTEQKLRKRQGGPFKLFARKVILAAGTFGSTEILLRSRSDDLPFSARLGHGFSGNGDQIAALYDQKIKSVNAVVDEMLPYGSRKVGPTITGLVKVPDAAGPIVIEELAIPGSLKRLFDEVVTTAYVLNTLDKADTSPHRRDQADPCAVDPEALARTSIVAMMGHDGANGAIELVGGAAEADGDGAVRVRWPEVREHPLFGAQVNVLRRLAKAGVGGTVIPNPLWQFVPESMHMLFDDRRGPVFTVHPLGGCPMGADARHGVVNECGQVFDAAPDIERFVEHGKLARKQDTPHVWPDLIVLDGSVVPTSLAINPALTIAALALHAVKKLRSEWQFRDAPPDVQERMERPLVHPRIVTIEPSRFELLERLHGDVTLVSQDRRAEQCVVELTLKFRQIPLTNITGREKVPLEVNAAESLLRIYRAHDWHEARRLGWPEERLAQCASITAPLSGTLTTFVREETNKWRTWIALWAWWRNRGARDIWQWLFGPRRKGNSRGAAAARAQQTAAPPAPAKGFGARLGQRFRTRWERLRSGVQRLVKTVVDRARNAYALASHAREARRFEYDLTLGTVNVVKARGLEIPALKRGAKIFGVKRLTYARRSNPWRQLMEMNLQVLRPDLRHVAAFPGLHPRSARILELDMKYLGEQGVPLFRIMGQPDQPTALGDLAALLGYLARVMLKVHVWSFRRPDAQDPREPQRLPGNLPRRLWGYHKPQIKQLEVDQLPDGTPVYARLTNYRPRRPREAPPVVMIHGYSTSGTTFAHPAVAPNLATHFLARRRDVWILDLRMSSGMPTARHPWTFEDSGLVDIPAALAHVHRETGGRKIDVIAHCMGAAMFSMAVLARPEPGEKFSRERAMLPSIINRVVLSQVGPLVQFTPANVLRSYVLSYLRHFLPVERYEFRIGPDPSLGDQLLDRLLSSLPYPVEEFDLENPIWWMPWRRATFTGTRHRMDALYARDMNLRNMSSEALEHIDDLFGPLSLETVSQAAHFAKHKVITNRAGRNVFVSRLQLRTRWRFPTLSIHGRDNGLVDFATVAHMERGFRGAGLALLETQVVDGYGHQDSLIGKRASKVFRAMSTFLEKPIDTTATQRQPAAERVTARVPWIGPHRGAPIAGLIPVRAATDPGPNKAGHVALVPVRRREGRFERARGGEAEIRLYFAPQGRDGWVRLMLQFGEEWLGDAEGVLMLFLHDQPSEMNRALFSPRGRRLRAILRGQQIELDGEPNVELGEYFKRKPRARQRVLDYLQAITKPVQAALTAALERPCAELEPALLEVPRETEGRVPLSFAFGSCQYPPGLLDGEVADASMRLLAEQLDAGGPDRPQFLLLLGDQVYVDATAGLFDPSTTDDRYVKTYERTFQRKGLQSVLRRLPAYMLLDDHEIDDNFERSVDDVRDDPRLLEGRRSYWRYQRFDKFKVQGSFGYLPRNSDRDPKLSRSFMENGFPFYMADTRSRRQARTARLVMDADIMEEAEFQELLDWLGAWQKKAPYAPKFVASPAMLLPRHLWASGTGCAQSALRSDGWDGYPRSFGRLFAYIVKHRITNVVFLSGDEHLSCVATATFRQEGKAPLVVHSIHSSALYAPFPFANGDRVELLAKDSFPVKPMYRGEPEIECTVDTDFAPPGDGYAVICLNDPLAQTLTCTFHRQYGPRPFPLPLVARPAEEALEAPPATEPA
jgi:choline dehydrogenase-like flavoprotein/alpha-beta hydrolase superfamily lysophospholipase